MSITTKQASFRGRPVNVIANVNTEIKIKTPPLAVISRDEAVGTWIAWWAPVPEIAGSIPSHVFFHLKSMSVNVNNSKNRLSSGEAQSENEVDSDRVRASILFSVSADTR